MYFSEFLNMGPVRIFFYFVFCFQIALGFEGRECSKRYYDQESFVCICNDDYCDFPGLTSFPSDGEYVRIRSSRDEYRFFEDKALIDGGNTGSTNVDINLSVKRQNALGFGGAFTDSTGYNVLVMSKSLQHSWVRSYFSPEGIEYTVCRVPIGGSDFSLHPYTLDEVVGDVELEHFSLTIEDFEYKIPFIKAAMDATQREILILGSPWSPPPWMKENGMHNGTGGLLREMWDPYSNYFVRFIQDYEANGVPIWGITPQNEPLTGFEDWMWNTCSFTKEEMRDWIKGSLGPIIEAAGLRPRVQILVLDHNRDAAIYYPNATFSDPIATQYVDGTAMHWYEDHRVGPEVLNELHNLYPEKYILYTEACEGWDAPMEERVLLGSWLRAEEYAYNIIEDLNHYSTGWIDWNMALSTTGGPNWADNFVDSPTIINQNEFLKQPTFYAMGHFSKYIQPNSTYVHTVVSGTADIKAASFLEESTGRLVVVLLNRSEEEESVNIVTDETNRFTLTMSAKSIESIIFTP